MVSVGSMNIASSWGFTCQFYNLVFDIYQKAGLSPLEYILFNLHMASLCTHRTASSWYAGAEPRRGQSWALPWFAYFSNEWTVTSIIRWLINMLIRHIIRFDPVLLTLAPPVLVRAFWSGTGSSSWHLAVILLSTYQLQCSTLWSLPSTRAGWVGSTGEDRRRV
jgi:hypothetical protein